MGKEIEDFLDLDKEKIKKRRYEILTNLPTKPGLGFLEVRLKKFKVQPWPFIIYLAYYNPEFLEDHLIRYGNYDGAENREAIMEELREYYIMSKLVIDGEKIERNKEKIIRII